MNEIRLIKWKNENEELVKEMDQWRDSYYCRQNCKEWKKWNFCRHLREARAKKFSKEIDRQINQLILINNH